MRQLLFAVGFALFTACGGEGTGPTAHVGTYDLVSVGGDPVPHSSHPVLSATLELRASWRFSESWETETGDAEYAGDYDVEGDAITLLYDEDPPGDASGVISGGRITIAISGGPLVYERR